MRTAFAERARERPQSKQEYLTAFDRDWALIHDGRPSEAGLKRVGSLERKEVCEDVALKSLKHGLFLVADGVGRSHGWLASREAARAAYEALGEELDKGIDNLKKEAAGDRQRMLEQVNVLIASRMIAVIGQAESRLKALSARMVGQPAKTTLSMAKLVELPGLNGSPLRRLVFANVGDSRIYVQMGGGRLRQVSRDHSLLQRHVDRGDLTPAQAREIDQAENPLNLPHELREYAAQRAGITNAVGNGHAADDLHVSYIDLQPGDRLLLVSDGVSDQLLEREMLQAMQSAKQDGLAQDELVDLAMSRALDGRHPRAKPDDISVVVHTIS